MLENTEINPKKMHLLCLHHSTKVRRGVIMLLMYLSVRTREYVLPPCGIKLILQLQHCLQ